MENTTQPTAIQLFNNTIEITKNGGEILAHNQNRSLLGNNKISELITEIEANGMTAELDTRASNVLSNCSTARQQMNEARKPITQMFTAIAAQFTAAENSLDPTKPENKSYKLQLLRNQYAAELKRKEQELAQAAQLKANIENEIIEIKSGIEIQALGFANEFLLSKKQSMLSAFNAITLDNFEQKSQALSSIIIEYPVSILQNFAPALKAFYMNAADAAEIVSELKNVYNSQNSANDFAKKYVSELQDVKNELIAKLPSKKLELERAASASVDEKILIEAQAAQRAIDEQNAIAAQAAAVHAKKQEKIESQKLADQTMVMFDQVAEAKISEPMPEARGGFEIDVLHPAAYVQIFHFWFEREGKNLDVEKIANTKLSQMKAYCEKIAKADGETIESKHMVYNSTIKAVNRKAK